MTHTSRHPRTPSRGARIRGRLAAAVALAALAAALPASASAATNLGAYWNLNENAGTTAKDGSANLNHGVIDGAAWIPGRFGSALQFDGADRVTIPRSSSMEPATLTVETWIRAASSPGPFRYIISQGASGCLVASYGLYTDGYGNLTFYVSNGTRDYTAIAPVAPAAVWDGAWHHVAGTYDGATVRLFVDGLEVGAGTPATLMVGYELSTSDDGFLGTFGGTCALPFIGALDEPRVWRRALSAEEIAASAAMGDAATKQIDVQLDARQALVYSSRFSSGQNVKLSIESATGGERISSVRIQQLLPIGNGFGCGGGVLFGPCDLTLSNGGRTAQLSVTRQRPGGGGVTLRVELASGRRLLVDVAT